MDRFGLSLGVSPREPLRRVGELAEQIESRGFEALWVIDFQVGMKDVHAAMLLAALHTSRLLIGPGVTNLSTRHATVTANAITALDEISDGRALLGLGAGWSAVFAAGGRPAKLAEIKEGVAQLRGLFAGESVKVGEHEVRLATARRQVPIYLAAAQPGMLRLAGETADGVILMGAAEPEFCEWQLGFIREGLERSGRDRSALIVDLQVTMSVDEDLEKALADVRAWATSQAATFVDWKQMPPSYERFRPEFDKASRSYHLVDHLSLHAEHKGAVSEEFTRLVAIAGDERHCVERLRELSRLDVDRISFALLSGGRERRLDQLSRAIIPAISKP
jgi:5,10-methylenetetrahydromethanopterin reductase